MAKRKEITNENVADQGNGQYCWLFERSMYKNYDELKLIVKVIMGMLVGIMLFLFLIILCSSGFDEAWGFVKGFSVVFPIFGVLIVPSYYLVCMMKGGKYNYVFEMDEKQIVTREFTGDPKKSKAYGALVGLAAVASLAGGAGRGLYALNKGTKLKRTNRYKDVQRIVHDREHGIIYLHERVGRYPIYLKDSDFDFVANYLAEHCTKATVE